jgi:urease accessory protein
VLVHPPGGIVGGDTLDIDARLEPGTHALLTTPGATRFYRSAGEPAVQSARVVAAPGARLEWLPLETIAYSGCLAHNRLRFELAPGAQMIGWDVLALGLPAAGQAFAHGSFLQEIALPGLWLERGRIDAADARLLDSPLGLDGHRVIATLWLAGGEPLPAALREGLLEQARSLAAEDGELPAGSTSPQAPLVLLRVLAHRVEPAMRLLMRVRAAWRRTAWQLEEHAPRVWRT